MSKSGAHLEKQSRATPLCNRIRCTTNPNCFFICLYKAFDLLNHYLFSPVPAIYLRAFPLTIQPVPVHILPAH
ncbi:hypothetical protein AOQ84DRAFT_184025 [Glonium stellatum]|uniref:Uncharacterized protein n=1 Tax=Glonium stellatum TaxID=574774 RepID=A0A8E2F774_9PEZI|nr:hypothetical protein AOQ84DRAFT_184025 [Glonium stellatum]